MTVQECYIFTCSLCRRRWTLDVRQFNDTQAYFRGVCVDCISEHKLTAVGIDDALTEYVDAVDRARAAVGD